MNSEAEKIAALTLILPVSSTGDLSRRTALCLTPKVALSTCESRHRKEGLLEADVALAIPEETGLTSSTVYWFFFLLSWLLFLFLLPFFPLVLSFIICLGLLGPEDATKNKMTYNSALKDFTFW